MTSFGLRQLTNAMRAVQQCSSVATPRPARCVRSIDNSEYVAVLQVHLPAHGYGHPLLDWGLPGY